MNRTRLKNYAPQARREFIQAVIDRAAYYGLTARSIEPINESGDTAIIAGLAFPRGVAAKRRALEERIRRQGFAQVMEAMGYTWFNRMVAIRFMELHGYLGHGYLVLSHAEDKSVPEILEHAEHVELPGLDRDRVIEMKLDGAREAELYRMLLVAQCNALHAAMPFLFEKIDDETELLLPDNLLHTNSIVRRLVRDIDEADWQQVEIIGWLYQFYISEKKDEVIGRVVNGEDIPAATQLFTPNWIVKYMTQNSVGRMWLATYPQSALRAKMDYYIEPAEQTAEVQSQLTAITPAAIDPETITVLDPACGSGHILVEAYDLLKEIYLERGYRLRDIPKLILAKNLYGLDIDDRAAQLAAFALLMKARADDRRIFDAGSDEQLVNVFAIQESATIDAAGLAEALLNVKFPPRPEKNASRKDVIELAELFRHGKTLGSMISVPDELAAKLPAIARVVNENLSSGDLYARDAARTLLPFVQQAEVLARKYDCVIANPPYMGSKMMNGYLKSFAVHQFPGSKSDIFSMFTQRQIDQCREEGFLALVTPFVWMFISSYEEFRMLLISKTTFNSLIQLEYNAFEPACVPVCTFVLHKHTHDVYEGEYIKLSDFKGYQNQAPKTIEAIINPDCGWRYKASSKDFRKIPGSPIAYWISPGVRNIFEKNPSIENFGNACQGLSTANNDQFLRFWFEPSMNDISFLSSEKNYARWFPFNKGGPFRKWYGNLLHVVDWKSDGQSLRAYQPKAVIRNPDFYFREGVTWSDITSSSLSARYLPPGCIFGDVGPTFFLKDNRDLFEALAYLNSIIVGNLTPVINPTMHFQVGAFGKLPFAQRNDLNIIGNSRQAFNMAKVDWDSFETSWDFQTFSMLGNALKAATVEASFDNWRAQCDANIKRMQELETENNRLFIEAYGLQKELKPEVPEHQITLARAGREADIRRLVSYTIGCVMGRYSLDQPGLVYAHSGNRDFDASRYQTFAADRDGIVPVMEQDWFADDAAHRFVEFIAAAWPPERLEDNLRFIAASLSANRNEPPRETIRRYLAAGFFKDHLKTYKKRPIYWLFSSGRQRAFQALVYLHRYNEGTLARMRTEYVIPLQGKIAARIEHLATDITNAASTALRRKPEKEREALTKQQEELRAFDEKLRHYADRRIALDLDDGIKMNYGKFGDLLAEVKTVTGGAEE